MLSKNKKGNILTENIIFIVLNVIFITILVLFLFTRAGSAAIYEERYAKQIALMVDAAKPGMVIDLNMTDAIKQANKENFPIDKIVNITNNIVTVKLREKGGYSYSFFNDVQANANLKKDKQGYYFVISKK